MLNDAGTVPLRMKLALLQSGPVLFCPMSCSPFAAARQVGELHWAKFPSSVPDGTVTSPCSSSLAPKPPMHALSVASSHSHRPAC